MPTAHILIAALFSAGFISSCADQGPPLTAQAGGTIATGHFDSIKLNGGGHVTLRYGATERVTLLAGSTQYTRIRIEDGNELVIDACHSDCPNDYKLEIEIVTPGVEGAAIEGGGHIEAASGFPVQNTIAAAVNGGGHIDLRNVEAKMGNAAVNGGGHILIHADDTLRAAVEGGGSIRYAGNPQVMSAVNGGGSISRADGNSD